MSETTHQDLDALREGLRLVEEWRKTHEYRARIARVEANAEMERRQAGAYAAVAAVVRRELEAPATADVRELAREIIRSLDMIARNYDSYEYGLPVMTHYDEMVDTVVALLRTPAAPADGSARGALWDEVYEIVLDAMDEAHGPNGTLENAEMYADRILALLCPTRGETTTSTTRDEAMDTLTTLHADLGALLSDEDLTDEKLRRASETLLPQLYDALIPLVRTPRGEGEASGLAECIITCMGCGQDFDANDDVQARYHEAACEVVDHEPARVEIARRLRSAAFRSEAHGEEDGGEFCDLCGEMFDPSELGTVIGPLGQDDGVPRWYRCPRCARAYDAGYQQGQRDPRGDETADPTAIRF